MGRLIKYEWKKQRTSRMVILAMLAAGILAFVWGLIFDKGNGTAAGIIALLMFGISFLVLLYTGIESILVLNRDLRTKQSYMLWMVPKSIWEILGAKFIAAILQMFVVFASFVAAGCICLSVTVVKYNGIRRIFEFVRLFFQKVLEINGSWGDIVMFAIAFFIAWAEVIFVGFLAVLLARTVLAKSRFAGLAAVILFFILTYVVEKGWSILHSIPIVGDINDLFGWNPLMFVYYVLVCLILFGVSGWIADKKLSV